ncbi:hypothetical protein [Wohlfahrtiimonas larvae]|uniref:Small CPxCG-related zinc finger protein n=1 Tax=Wohlfahrtiimonas larvae TaxID=1157986 RepID=A0ABP9MLE3_9GAMM|nr:hypothetical protein [Wohlfahrtiimonas larvae]
MECCPNCGFDLTEDDVLDEDSPIDGVSCVECGETTDPEYLEDGVCLLCVQAAYY